MLGLKCKYCKSFNTNQLQLRKPGEEVVEILPDNNGGEHEHIVDFDANIMRLVQTNLESNFGIDLQQ